MRLLINLESNFKFWQINSANLTRIRDSFPGLHLVKIEDQESITEELEKAHIYFGWNFNSEWLAHCQDLEWIVCPAAGTNHLPVNDIEKKEILLTNLSGFHAIPMAQQAFGYILGFSRGLFLSKSLQQKKEWWKEDIYESFFDLCGETMTIVGCGSIGKHIANIARMFDMHVIGIRRNIDQIEETIEWMRPDQCHNAFTRSKIIINLLPLTGETAHFFDRTMFLSMNKGTIFINLGRGETVDENALIESIDKKIIAGCALDVFANKPPAMDNQLRGMEEVIMTPKTGVFYHKYMDSAVECFISLLNKYLAIREEMNTRYAKRKYQLIAYKKYFNTDRIVKLQRSASIKDNSELLDSSLIREKFLRTKRNIPYLALTVNSVCNRDCLFCSPSNNKEEHLDLKDYQMIAREAACWGIKKAHISGGEPTLKRGIVQIIQILKEELGSQSQVNITTHGNIPQRLINEMHEAGIDHINFSLHSLDPQNYREIMGGGNPDITIERIDLALNLGIKVKINAVIMRSYLDDTFSLLELARKRNIAIRFIELQEIGPAKKIFGKEFVSQDEFIQRAGLLLMDKNEVERTSLKVRAPGKYFNYEGWKGSVSFISNTSRPFCGDGNRIKITPNGYARPCTLNERDIYLGDYIDNNDLSSAFTYLFNCILNRDNDSCHRGFHYIDYDLRWENIPIKEKHR